MAHHHPTKTFGTRLRYAGRPETPSLPDLAFEPGHTQRHRKYCSTCGAAFWAMPPAFGRLLYCAACIRLRVQAVRDLRDDR